MRNLNETINLQSHQVDRVDDVSSTTSAVISEVNKLKIDYSKKFGLPNYVKLPMRLYSAIKCTESIYTEVTHPLHPEMLLGLIVCPTLSTQMVDEIEVF